jgi:hypothetical protein
VSASDNRLSPQEVETMRQDMQRVLEAAEMDFENKLLIISTGALGLSVAFIDVIVPLADARYKWILITGWGLLAVCLIVNLCSQLYSAHAVRQGILELNDAEKSRTQKINGRNNVTKWVNLISAALLGLGVISLVVFAASNMPKKTPQPATQTSEVASTSIPTAGDSAHV